MLRRSKAAASFVLAAFSLMMVGTPDAQAPNYQIPSRPVSLKSFFGWIVVVLLQMTSRYGRRAKTSEAVSNSRLLAGL
jgi:hypothetical protein